MTASRTPAESTISSEQLVDALPSPPGAWERTNMNDGIVEYRYAGPDGVCALAKVTVRRARISEAAVRVDRKQRCQNVGTTRHDDLQDAVTTVQDELTAVLADTTGT